MKLRFDEILETTVIEGSFLKNIEAVGDFLECLMDELCDLSPEIYEKMVIKYVKLINNGMFTKDLAQYAVKHMENENPIYSKGGRWNWEETEMIAKEHSLPVATHGMPAVYFALNMCYSDYFDQDLPPDETEYYAKLAGDWLDDKDAKVGKSKSFDYYFHIIRGY